MPLFSSSGPLRLPALLLLMASSACLAQVAPAPICASPAELPPPGTNPALSYVARPLQIDLGQIPVGGTGTGQFCITTTGPASGTANFKAATGDVVNFPLLDTNQNPVQSVSFGANPYALGSVQFRPLNIGQASTTLLVTANGVLPMSISLRGTGVAGIAINPSALPNGTVGQAYRVTFTANGGTAPYTWKASSPLPPGLILTDNLLSGVPTAAGPFTITITVSDASRPPLSGTQSFQLTIQVPNRPVINAVVNGASFLPGITQSAWVTLLGTNFSGTTRTWTDAEIATGALPTSLDGVSVTINRRNAFVYYISPTQINVISPADNVLGTVSVLVTNNGVASDPAPADLSLLSPAFFLLPGGRYIAAVHLDGTLVGPPGFIPGAVSSPAQPGEILLLFANGLGPTNPPIAPERLTDVVAPIINKMTLTFGNSTAGVLFAGLVPPFARLYQLNVTVPADAPPGDLNAVITIGGQTSPASMTCCFITIGN